MSSVDTRPASRPSTRIFNASGLSGSCRGNSAPRKSDKRHATVKRRASVSGFKRITSRITLDKDVGLMLRTVPTEDIGTPADWQVARNFSNVILGILVFSNTQNLNLKKQRTLKTVRYKSPYNKPQ